MPKTITLRVDDDIYKIFKTAADGDRRSISSFLEKSALYYLSHESYVSDSEMNEIENDKELTSNLHKSLREIGSGDYEFIE